MSSDKLANLQQPLVTLDLDLGSPEVQDHHSVSVEMDGEELSQLITSLEAANKVNYHIINSLLTFYFSYTHFVYIFYT